MSRYPTSNYSVGKVYWNNVSKAIFCCRITLIKIWSRKQVCQWWTNLQMVSKVKPSVHMGDLNINKRYSWNKKKFKWPKHICTFAPGTNGCLCSECEALTISGLLETASGGRNKVQDLRKLLLRDKADCPLGSGQKLLLWGRLGGQCVPASWPFTSTPHPREWAPLGRAGKRSVGGL